MDYFKEAFGGFDPLHDRDAALKFCLDVLMADHRVDELARLLSSDRQFGGVGGEPGWIIECRNDSDREGYESWPDDARFRAYVDPTSYQLAYPEFFASRASFLRYVQAIVPIYKRRFPQYLDRLQCVEERIKPTSTL